MQDLPLQIETPRLLLRLPTIEDVSVVHAAKMDQWDELSLWMRWTTKDTKTLENTEEAIRKYFQPKFENRNLKDLLLFGFCKETGRFVLSTGFHVTDPEAGLGNSISIGYWVAKPFEGKGYVSEAANALTRYALQLLEIEQVVAAIDSQNTKSRNVAEKLGYQVHSTVAGSGAPSTKNSPMAATVYMTLNDISRLPPLEVRWNVPNSQL